MWITDKQMKYWDKRMMYQERQCVGYYSRFPEDTPDGSWAMDAFRQGVEVGIRLAKRKAAGE